MKEHLLTIFLAFTTGITLFIFSFISSRSTLPVFDFDDLLFEHQTIHGNIVITSNPYGEFTLSFLNRDIGGLRHAGSAYEERFDSDISFLNLPANADIPFTIHAVVSSNPDLHEVIIMESGSQIAHGTHAKKTTCEHCSPTAVFMVASSDLTGEDVLILGLNQQGEILVEIEIP